MGTFIDIGSNIYKSLANIPKTIITADTNVIVVSSINITNKGPAPIRFNLLKNRIQGTSTKTCYAASTANLIDATYDNGLSGIGATLTNSPVSPAVFTIDGITPPLNSRILIKNQTTNFQNGIYVLTNVGSNIIPWVLTRASDYNKPSQIHIGDLIRITNGNTNINTIWNQQSIVTTIGTSPITFIENVPSSISLINEMEIKPYANINVICSTGTLQLEYSLSPFVSDSLIAFTNGYTQVYDCDVNYTKFNELS